MHFKTWELSSDSYQSKTMTSPAVAGWRLGMPFAEVSETTTPLKSEINLVDAHQNAIFGAE
jgi:hypothetical protein